MKRAWYCSRWKFLGKLGKWNWSATFDIRSWLFGVSFGAAHFGVHFGPLHIDGFQDLEW